MKKKNAHPEQIEAGAAVQAALIVEAHPVSPREFKGTSNPRHLRALQALRTRPQPREAVDRIAGCSNGPALISDLRHMGLDIPCERQRKLDRDMFVCFPGVYRLTSGDLRRIGTWLRRRDQEGVAC